jgi:16S rRNA (guanine1516-N2)-methyltransferase
LKNKKQVKITVKASDNDVIERAQELATRLGLPLEAVEDFSAGTGKVTEQDQLLLLRVSNNGLGLIKSNDPQLSGAVRVDFTAGHTAYRRKQQKKELLVRAVEGKGQGRLRIIDATGGLGRDSFLLATAGHQVCIFEQQPIIAALLADGLERAAAHPETAEICQRIQLKAEDAVSALEAMLRVGADEEEAGEGEQIDVVYLDPMFPERRKAALVKKELQLLQLLAEIDQAPEQLLTAALQVAEQRVVVKRPIKAPVLTEHSPSYSLSGKTIRFDVYLSTEVSCLTSS